MGTTKQSRVISNDSCRRPLEAPGRLQRKKSIMKQSNTTPLG